MKEPVIKISWILEKDIKLYKCESTKRNKPAKKTFLFVPGLHFKAVNIDNDSKTDSELYGMQFLSGKLHIDSHYFNYFVNSTRNKNPYYMTIENFYKELASVIKYLEDYYDEIIPVSNSFGSILLLKLQKGDSAKIKKTFLCGPTSPSDQSGIFKHRSNDENFIGEAIKLNKYDKNECVAKLIDDNTKWIAKTNSNKEISHYFIRGENEADNFINSIDEYINSNDDHLSAERLYTLDKCGHNVYLASKNDGKTAKKFLKIVKFNL